MLYEYKSWNDDPEGYGCQCDGCGGVVHVYDGFSCSFVARLILQFSFTYGLIRLILDLLLS